MRSGLGAIGRTVTVAVAMAGNVALAGLPARSAGAAPPQAPVTRLAGTWGACGSWWSETTTRTESGSVCGVDGLVTDNGQPTQLAEPLVSVTRYVCEKRRAHQCNDESWTGTVRRSEMTVDPVLRRASIRGTLGGCTLDVEFAGLGPARPQGGVWENHGHNGSAPTVSVGGSQTFTSQASWWGAVCGQTVVSRTDHEGQAWMFRGTEASIGGFGGDGHECHAAAASRPTSAC
jgi:hypothetical protein